MKILRITTTIASMLILPSLALAASGDALFNKKCKMCHSLEAGKNKGGPSLSGVFGRKAGSTDFKRYKGLKGADFVWSEESLDGFLTSPKKFLGKKSTMMVKVKKPADRAAIIEFLKTQ